MSPELTQLIELQELDLEVLRLTERLSRIPEEREHLEDHFKQSAAEFLEIQTRHTDLAARRKQLEIDLSDTQQLHEKYKADLMRVRNEREYATALREIDATRKQAGTYETEILRGMEEIERLDAQLKVLAPDMEKQRAEIDARLATLEAEQTETETRLAAVRRRRDEVTGSLPAHLFETYERVSRRSRGLALAWVNDGNCSACRMRVRPKIFSDVKRGNDLITCEHCGRILYFRNDEAKPVEVALSQQGASE